MDSIPIDRQTSLLDQHAKLKREAEKLRESEKERLRREEQKILENAQAAQALMAASELAKGVKYDKPLKSGWRPARHVRHRKESENDEIRKEYDVVVEGTNIPPPCLTFEDMKLPRAVTKELNRRGISSPNPFQMQALPVLFSGRDMIGIASTGSGKTLVFELPLLMFCLEQQVSLPFVDNEGPYGLILCPSRDLAEQTFKDFCSMRDAIEDDLRIRLNVGLCIGGVPSVSMIGGCHIIVATTGRLLDNLKRRLFNLDICRYLCLDEADRMLDKFEEDLRKVFTYFKYQRQTVFFSATMPRKIQNFAMSAMVQPVTVNVSGRAGAANKRIQQDVEYVKQDAKLYHLLTAIEKTGPPVIIFARRPQDVDSIHEYLLLKGLSVSAIHGQKHQDDRSQAVDDFRAKKTDILVATDVASKGLDFQGIKHVINYDTPAAIEDYIHRIGVRKVSQQLSSTNRMMNRHSLISRHY
jgi:ATP-dependent RNA helicase DDX41